MDHLLTWVVVGIAALFVVFLLAMIMGSGALDVLRTWEGFGSAVGVVAFLILILVGGDQGYRALMMVSGAVVLAVIFVVLVGFMFSIARLIKERPGARRKAESDRSA
jgi:hypothetical protein